jgi:hypothetical protein
MEVVALILYFLLLLQLGAAEAHTQIAPQVDPDFLVVLAVVALRPQMEQEGQETHQALLLVKVITAEMAPGNQEQQKSLEVGVAVLMRLEQQVRQPLVAMVVMVLHRVFLVLL